MDNVDKKALPTRLEELRKTKGYTQKQLAESLGISAAMYNRVIKGERLLPSSHLEKVATLLDADVSELHILSLVDKVKDETKNYPDEIVLRALSLCQNVN